MSTTTTTDDQQPPQLTNGEVKSSPTEIESTDNGNADSSPEMESTANEDLDLNPKEVKQVKNDDEIKEEGNKTFTMRELLNELKNGDGNEGSEPAADTATPRRLDEFRVVPDIATLVADSEVAPDTATLCRCYVTMDVTFTTSVRFDFRFADSEVAPYTATPFGFDFVLIMYYSISRSSECLHVVDSARALLSLERDVTMVCLNERLGVVLAGDGAEVVLAMNDYATLSG
ncbi:hypothetical protein Tco_1170791 [Tanacetum coccineum]